MDAGKFRCSYAESLLLLQQTVVCTQWTPKPDYRRSKTIRGNDFIQVRNTKVYDIGEARNGLRQATDIVDVVCPTEIIPTDD
jgi:hypothetical protein